jgi:hypothetical protein
MASATSSTVVDELTTSRVGGWGVGVHVCVCVCVCVCGGGIPARLDFGQWVVQTRFAP